jgi:hypothetical protein
MTHSSGTIALKVPYWSYQQFSKDVLGKSGTAGLATNQLSHQPMMTPKAGSVVRVRASLTIACFQLPEFPRDGFRVQPPFKGSRLSVPVAPSFVLERCRNKRQIVDFVTSSDLCKCTAELPEERR